MGERFNCLDSLLGPLAVVVQKLFQISPVSLSSGVSKYLKRTEHTPGLPGVDGLKLFCLSHHGKGPQDIGGEKCRKNEGFFSQVECISLSNEPRPRVYRYPLTSAPLLGRMDQDPDTGGPC